MTPPNSPRRGAGFLTRARAFAQSPLAPICAVNFCVAAGLGMVWTILAVYTTSLGASAYGRAICFAYFGSHALDV